LMLARPHLHDVSLRNPTAPQPAELVLVPFAAAGAPLRGALQSLCRADRTVVTVRTAAMAPRWRAVPGRVSAAPDRERQPLLVELAHFDPLRRMFRRRRVRALLPPPPGDARDALRQFARPYAAGGGLHTGGAGGVSEYLPGAEYVVAASG